MFTKKPQMMAVDGGSLLIKTFGSADVNCYTCQKRKDRAAVTLTDGSFSFSLDQKVRCVPVFRMHFLKLNVYLHRIKMVLASANPNSKPINQLDTTDQSE